MACIAIISFLSISVIQLSWLLNNGFPLFLIFLSLFFGQRYFDSCASRNQLWQALAFVSTSDVMTFDQNWHHLYSSSARRNDLSNHTQIRVISLIESQICSEIWVKNALAKLPATTLSYPMVKTAWRYDAFSEIFKLEVSPVEGQSLPQKR